MKLTPLEMWMHMGLPARLIVAVMLAMSLLAVVVMIERVLALRASKKSSLRFASALSERLKDGDVDRAAQALEVNDAGHLGRVLQVALNVYQTCPKVDGELTFESVARALERQAQREVHGLKRNLGLLASIASIAPFIGLLGTVVGIVDSFLSMAETGSGGLSTVSAGIAEALATTAIGLLIAIPSMAAYNALAEWTDGFAVDIAEASNELLDLLAHHLSRTQHGGGRSIEQAQVPHEG